MLSTIKQRLGREGEEGFTLIELMVVVLIIAILLAIAIPTFLGARGAANARAAQSNLRNALTAEQTIYTNGQAFDNTVANLQAIEPNLNWGAMPATTAANNVGVSLATNTVANDTVFLQAQGKDGKCYTTMQVNGTAAPATGYNVANGNCVAPSTASPLPAVGAGKAGDPANITAGGFYTSW